MSSLKFYHLRVPRKQRSNHSAMYRDRAKYFTMLIKYTWYRQTLCWYVYWCKSICFYQIIEINDHNDIYHNKGVIIVYTVLSYVKQCSFVTHNVIFGLLLDRRSKIRTLIKWELKNYYLFWQWRSFIWKKRHNLVGVRTPR